MFFLKQKATSIDLTVLFKDANRSTASSKAPMPSDLNVSKESNEMAFTENEKRMISIMTTAIRCAFQTDGGPLKPTREIPKSRCRTSKDNEELLEERIDETSEERTAFLVSIRKMTHRC